VVGRHLNLDRPTTTSLGPHPAPTISPLPNLTRPSPSSTSRPPPSKDFKSVTDHTLRPGDRIVLVSQTLPGSSGGLDGSPARRPSVQSAWLARSPAPGPEGRTRCGGARRSPAGQAHPVLLHAAADRQARDLQEVPCARWSRTPRAQGLQRRRRLIRLVMTTGGPPLLRGERPRAGTTLDVRVGPLDRWQRGSRRYWGRAAASGDLG
jgi:hypothetical protein